MAEIINKIMAAIETEDMATINALMKELDKII